MTELSPIGGSEGYAACPDEGSEPMTVADIIIQVDAVKPNAFSDETKVMWLNALEGRIMTEVMLMDIHEVRPYVWPECGDYTPLVDPPHDDLYGMWLTAQIDLANGEYEKYQNSMAVFNAAFGGFVRWFAERYEPAQGYER